MSGLNLGDLKHFDPEEEVDEEDVDRGDQLDGSSPDDEDEDEDEGAEAAEAGEEEATEAKAEDTSEADATAARTAAQSARRDAEDNVDRKDWVPPHRLREATAERKAAEARVRELEAQNIALQGSKDRPDPVGEVETELDALYNDVEEARAEGRTADAAKMQRQIDGLNRKVTEINSERVATQRALAVAQTTAYDAMVEEIETKFPELNPDNEKYFDAELAAEVLDLARGFQHTKNLAPKAALAKALSYVFKEEYLERGTAGLYSGKPAAAKSAPVPRKSEAVKRNLKASSRQPPVLTDTGKSDGTADQMNAGDYSEDAWEKLPEATKSRLRGDFVGA